MHYRCGLCLFSAMTYVGQLAGFRNLSSFGWVSDSSDLQDRSVYNTLLRLYPPINAFGMLIDKNALLDSNLWCDGVGLRILFL